MLGSQGRTAEEWWEYECAQQQQQQQEGGGSVGGDGNGGVITTDNRGSRMEQLMVMGGRGGAGGGVEWRQLLRAAVNAHDNELQKEAEAEAERRKGEEMREVEEHGEGGVSSMPLQARVATSRVTRLSAKRGAMGSVAGGVKGEMVTKTKSGKYGKGKP